MTLAEHDVVRLRRHVQDADVEVGSIGAIVVVYEAGAAYEVEFCDADGVTRALLTLLDADIEKVDPMSPAR